MTIIVDGSMLEGGGQILRMASSLSCLLKKTVKVINIRANRPKPGLRNQHLLGLQLTEQICGGKLEGGKVGSTEITLHPETTKGGAYSAQPDTPSSVSLMFQSLLPCSLFADKTCNFSFSGGTNASFAPQIDYTVQVFKKVCSKFEINFEISIETRNFGNVKKPNGKVSFSLEPIASVIPPLIMLERGQVVKVYGSSFVTGNLPIKLAQAMAAVAKAALKSRFGESTSIDIRTFKEEQLPNDNGASIILCLETDTGCIFGGSAFIQGGQSTPPKRAANEAVNDLLKAYEAGGCLDTHAQDQVIIFMALANGKSKIRASELTLHTKTAIYVAELLTDAKFTVTPDVGSTFIVECDGIGLKREQQSTTEESSN